jgi:delta-aminolevulinic acid dehydratase/porphobilinogen synthase
MNPVKTAHTLDLVRRARRLRRTSGIRSYVRETRLSADQFVYPLFVVGGTGVRREVPSMPGVFQLSVDEALRETAIRPLSSSCAPLCLMPPRAPTSWRHPT